MERKIGKPTITNELAPGITSPEVFRRLIEQSEWVKKGGPRNEDIKKEMEERRKGLNRVLETHTYKNPTDPRIRNKRNDFLTQRAIIDVLLLEADFTTNLFNLKKS